MTQEELNFDFLKEFIYSKWGKAIKEFADLDVSYSPANSKSSKGEVKVTLTLPFAWCESKELSVAMEDYLRTQLSQSHGEDFVNNLTFSLEKVFKISARKASGEVASVPGVKNIVAISSAKGGVGKSTITVNLAHALAKQGLRIGVLDADIYGPSIPFMVGAEDRKPTSPDNKTMDPVFSRDLYCNSIGFLVPDTDPTIWRGPVASTMLKQLMAETNWPDLDYLLIDMPPGTGDIQITAAQSLSLSGAVVISTPQEVALLDVMKGINMFKEVSVPVVGLVDNMNLFKCPHCGEESKLFSYDGVKEMAEVFGIPLLGTIPFDPKISRDLDEGHATTYSDYDSEIAKVFSDIADQAAFQLFISTKSAAPTIAIKSL